MPYGKGTQVKIDPTTLSDRDNYYLLMGVVVPRPIAWVSTMGQNGVANAAPFSGFMVASSRPPIICFSVAHRHSEKKDTVRNIEYTGDFVVNVVDELMAEAMNVTGGDFPPEVSEFKEARLTPVPGDLIRSPRIGEAPISLECRVERMFQMGADPNTVIFGNVLRYHLRDGLYGDGQVDPTRLKPLGRLAKDFYCHTQDIFVMKRHAVPSFEG